ncbi:MAG: terpene cyclase/mutase family protein [Planctomycetes bacterium]|nr:terpene cyclase/mutase family protein [Planctomycetota bacterium]
MQAGTNQSLPVNGENDYYEEDAGIGAALAAEMHGAPWYLSSVAAHMVLFLVLLMIPVSSPDQIERTVVIPVMTIEEPVIEDKVVEDMTPPDKPVDVEVEKQETFEPKISDIVPDVTTKDLDIPDMDPTDDVVGAEEIGSTDAMEQFNDNFTQPAVIAINNNGPSGSKGPFGWRRRGTPTQKKRITKRYDFPPVTSAVNALNWLAAHQEPSGNWSCEKYGGAGHDTSVTAMAVLAFLANGNGPGAGKFCKNVEKGVEWLLSQQDASGRVGPHRYEAAFGTMALAEAYGMSNNSWKKKLKDPAQRAIDYAVASQCTAGGWDYAPKSKRNDTSVTGWWVMAIKSAKVAGLHVEKGVFEKALAYMQAATTNEGSVSYAGDYAAVGNVKAGGGSIRMSAVSLTCQYFLGGNVNDPKFGGALRKVAPQGMNADKLDFYLWYYQGLGLLHRGPRSGEWKNFAGNVKVAIYGTQINKGKYEENRGSWNPDTDPYGAKWGRVGQTAIGALILSLPWRYEVKA